MSSAAKEGAARARKELVGWLGSLVTQHRRYGNHGALALNRLAPGICLRDRFAYKRMIRSQPDRGSAPTAVAFFHALATAC
jgi:hypothetical protein